MELGEKLRIVGRIVVGVRLLAEAGGGGHSSVGRHGSWSCVALDEMAKTIIDAVDVDGVFR